MSDVNRFWVIPPFYVQLQQKKTFLNYPSPFDFSNSVLNFLPFYLLTFLNTNFLLYSYFTFQLCLLPFTLFAVINIFFTARGYTLLYTYLLKHILKTLFRLSLLVNLLVLSTLFILLNWYFVYCFGLCFGTFYPYKIPILTP